MGVKLSCGPTLSSIYPPCLVGKPLRDAEVESGPVGPYLDQPGLREVGSRRGSRGMGEREQQAQDCKQKLLTAKSVAARNW
jgi:hypothetical protein